MEDFDLANALLYMIEESIRNNDVDTLSKLLVLVPYDEMDSQTINDFFIKYLEISVSFCRDVCIKKIYDKWNLVYPPSERIPLFSMMVMMTGFDEHTLAYILKLFGRDEDMEKHTYIDVMYDIISRGSVANTIISCQRAVKLFGEQPNGTYKILMDLSLENPNAYEFLSYKYRQGSEYAKIPEWMGNWLSSTAKISQSIPYESEVPLIRKELGSFDLPDVDEIVDMLTENMYGRNSDPNGEAHLKFLEEREITRQLLLAATPEQKIEIVRPVKELRFQESLQKDEELFRNSGPSNPMINSGIDDLVYEGCRMFTCMVFDFNEEEDRFEDWYEGYCHRCNLRIRRRWHAVRMPGDRGGWSGCYCSWECVRLGLDEEGFNPEMEPKTVQHLLVNLFEEQMKLIGIQDRFTDNDEVAEETSRTIVDSLNY